MSTTRGGRKCSCCTHAQTAEITKAIMAGDPLRAIASRFGVTLGSAQRHAVNCLRAPRKPEKPDREAARVGAGDSFRFDSNANAISSPKDLLDRLQSLFRLGDLLEEAYQKRDVDACVKLAREYRAAAESYAKVAGWMTDASAGSVLIDQRRQVVNVLAKLSEDELRALAAGDTIPGSSVAVGALQAAEPRETPSRS